MLNIVSLLNWGSESNISRSNKLFRKLNSTILWIRLNIARVAVNSIYNQTRFNKWDIIHTHEHKVYYDWLAITSSPVSWGQRCYVFDLHIITSNFWWCHYGKSKKNWSRIKTKYSQSWSCHQEIKCPVKYFGITWFSVQVPAHKIGTKFGSLMLPRWICHRVGTARSKSNWICIFMIFWDFKTFLWADKFPISSKYAQQTNWVSSLDRNSTSTSLIVIKNIKLILQILI